MKLRAAQLTLSEEFVARTHKQNLLHGENKFFIVIFMSAMFILSVLVLASSGALIARQLLRAKPLPLLRRAR